MFHGRYIQLVVAASALMAAAAPVRAQVGKPVTVVDANFASEKELAAMPNLTAPTVKAILDRRPFASISDLDALLSTSLSRQQLTELYGRLFVHLNLNTATREQILLIPNAGPRMAHEFEEYRPYKALAQFHREIDKYVDDQELARLEQYVFVPIDLNTASDADILTIPGLGSRMLHEFKEYRPYKAIEQFRREIGKYVDKREVARLERYVTIN
jgi:DNA uptake protein ComE-like DNA-binding protein